MQVVIAEKPSVAKEYAKVLGANKKEKGYFSGNGFIVSWCVGHLISTAEPHMYDEKYKMWSLNDLPILPEKWKYVVKKDTAAQFKVLRELLNRDDVDTVICGTDAGREGELIFRHVYKLSGCNKSIKRLWVSSMEETSLVKGFNELKDGHGYDDLYQAALLREKIDWLAGYNFSRLMTLLYGNGYMTWTIGRVQTATLNKICQRDAEIDAFVKQKYYVIHFENENIEAASVHFESEAEAKAVLGKCSNKEITVERINKTIKKVGRPKLYNLTTLQREASRLFGFTSDKTLDIAQALYEKGLTTYPRTDSAYLNENMVHTAEGVFTKQCEMFGIKTEMYENKALFDNSKVSDHHAIIPTNKDCNPDELTLDEQKIYGIVSMKLICAFNKSYVYESQKVVLSCEGTEFTAQGNKVVDLGFKDIEKHFLEEYKVDKEKNSERKVLPTDLTEGMKLAGKFTLKEEYTKPAARYDESSLLLAMEQAGAKELEEGVERVGLGTSATRAEIIKTLVARGYVQRDKKKLVSTEKGKFLISVAPEKIKSVDFTVEMENNLLEVSKGEKPASKILEEFVTYMAEIIESESSKNPDERSFFEGEVLCQCPKCKSNIVENKATYYCSNENCKVVLFKENKFFASMQKQFTKKMVIDMFTQGYTDVKGLTSKAGKNFDARIMCNFEDDGRVSYELKFKKGKKKGKGGYKDGVQGNMQTT